MSVQVKTFGCKVNYHDSLLIRQQLKGLSSSQGRDIYILNSCAVTAQAGRDIRKQADRIKRLYPDSLIALTGCGAQVETDLYEKNKSVDLIVGNSDKWNLGNILKDFRPGKSPRVFKSNIFKTNPVNSPLSPVDQDRTRAFLKIQDGCNSFCSFCVIPFARGKSLSRSMKSLTEAVLQLEDRGVVEAVLTGVHIGDYKDGDKGLEDLLMALLKNTGIPRIRLTSLEPVEITERLLDCYTDDRLCPHFHISLQSASSSVLKAMKRSYGRKETQTAFERIKKALPKAFVGMDVIVGFPAESRENFEESYNLLKDHSWTDIHVFPYSPRSQTYAFKKYGSLPQKEIVRRAGQLRHLAQARFKSRLREQKGSRKKALLFNKNNRRGLSRDYWKIELPLSSLSGEREVFIEEVDEQKDCLKASFL